ncbi:cysteine proteinase [Laetiporus sulphureus 93-53]|uniref:ubiquitinyl hydrolase 1 n=1 Tax=Laetiporus sulphureus 93-53 TaxID=1314785 RepID=A0A165EK87_9APHY|nr:cysteine proteinase [Laetiporus sulphureus 93-53]KZT07231.1 cysteine proteinase [Laetiporus sulphureus 93-53]
MQNGSRKGTVAEIKEVAKEQAHRVRGASAISLLGSARTQIQHAQECELHGDLTGALSALTKAASLAQMFMESSEFKLEIQPGRKGVLVKEFMDFQQREGYDLKGKVESVEAKLIEAEKSSQSSSEVEADAPPHATGGSIADRIRSLQNTGLAVSTTKRLSREVAPASPAASTAAPAADTSGSRPSPNGRTGSTMQNLPSPVLASSVASSSSPHALVPASSLGPPSPSSSTSSSPRLSILSLSDFAQTFPSIDELDEGEGPHMPSAPSGTDRGPLSPSAHSKPFPALPMDPGPRPSSTPIPHTIDTFISRPASPVRTPLSPSVPRKPSGLSLRSSASRSPVLPAATPVAQKPPEIPVTTTLFPKALMDYRQRSNYTVLLLDVRTREEFEKEHIKADAVVCIEPSVLLRSEVTSMTIEDSLVVAPRNEAMLFSNRNKFDLVAMYDDASESFGDASTFMSVLARAIYEMEFRKILKHPPMILVGGLQAWKREMGEAELMRGATSVSSGGVSAASLANGPATTHVNGLSSPTIASYSTAKSPTLPGHIRSAAESTMISSASASGFEHAGRHRTGMESSMEVGAYKPWAPTKPNGDDTENYSPVPFRSGMDSPLSPTLASSVRLVHKSPATRPASSPVSYPYNAAPPIPESPAAQHTSYPHMNGTSSIQYPSVARNISPQISGTSFSSSLPALNGMTPVPLPPQASIHPSPLSRRRSDYTDQSQEALSGMAARTPIDYPDLPTQHVLRPPPAAAASSLERQDNRPRLMQSKSYSIAQAGPKPPAIRSDYPVTYWSDIQIGTSGLKNLGNTCYMNSTIQCLSATVPFARFFTDGRWKSAVNMVNPLGTKGNLALTFANILRELWQGDGQCLSPVTFRRSLCQYAPQFGGSEQHDSQEFLNFLLDGLHEDLNRILKKPQIETTPEREEQLERLPNQIASEQEWQIYRMRNDSLVVDFFQGQFRNRMECMHCHKTSTTYNTFMYLSLPIPSGRALSKVTLKQCLDSFVKEEVMEKSEAWNCPHCKTLRRATKNLSLSRLPPVLLIHLKRFSSKGHFTDKIETYVDYPLRGLDLTNYMPPPLPPGINAGPQLSREDPRAQIPPYRYDLYAVTNHFGTLSSGHYTAFIASRGGWLYCDDSRISHADPKDVVGKPAYMLFYKRTRS